MADTIADLKAKLAEQQRQIEALTAAQASGGRKRGFHKKEISPFKKDGKPRTNPPRYVADYVAENGVYLQYCIGVNGKLCINMGYNSQGMTFWDNETAFEAFRTVVASQEFADNFYQRLPRGPEGLTRGLNK